jgi:hypothetical protein
MRALVQRPSWPTIAQALDHYVFSAVGRFKVGLLAGPLEAVSHAERNHDPRLAHISRAAARTITLQLQRELRRLGAFRGKK